MIIEASEFARLLKGIPPELATMIISMTPIFELRGAIPVAVGFYKLSISSAYFWSVIGNFIPVVFWVFFLEGITGFLHKRFKFWRKLIDSIFERTRCKAAGKIEKYGDWGLFFLVAIPLPVTGGWTGALAAFLFGIRKKKSLPIIFLGILAAGVIVSLLTIGVVKIKL